MPAVPDRAPAGTVTVRYFAAARAAAGTAQEAVPAASLAGLLGAVVDRHGEGLALVLKRCSYLVDGLAVHAPDTALPAGATVDVLPPFAGG